jgi:hypothetical protein
VTRTEHIAWVKQRALKYVAMGDLQEAFASYISDMGKHPEADPGHVVRGLAMQFNMAGHLETARQMREFIEGTN